MSNTEDQGAITAADIEQAVEFALTGAKTFSTLKDNFKEREIYTTTLEAWNGYFSTAQHPTTGVTLFSLADDYFKSEMLAQFNPTPAPATRQPVPTSEIDTGASTVLADSDGGPSGHDGLDDGDGTGKPEIKIIHHGGTPLTLAEALATDASAPSNTPFGNPDGQGSNDLSTDDLDNDDDDAVGDGSTTDPEDPQGAETVVTDATPKAPAAPAPKAPVIAKGHGPRKGSQIKPGKGGGKTITV